VFQLLKGRIAPQKCQNLSENPNLSNKKIIEKRVLSLFIISPCLFSSSCIPRTHRLTCSSLMSCWCVVSWDVIVTTLSLPSSCCIIFLFSLFYYFYATDTTIEPEFVQAQISCLCLGLTQGPRIWILRADWDLPKLVPNHPKKIRLARVLGPITWSNDFQNLIWRGAWASPECWASGEHDCGEQVPKPNQLYQTLKGMVSGSKKLDKDQEFFFVLHQNKTQWDGEKHSTMEEYLLIMG
jgi:hypothetical protein